MKRTFCIFLITLISFLVAIAQDQPNIEAKFQPGLSFSIFGKYDILTFLHPDGSAKYSSHSFYSCGISGSFKTKKMAKIETGLYFNKHIINIQQGFSDPPIYTTRESIALIEIPLNIRFDFKYFFITSGVMADIEIDNSNIIREQSGLGINTSVGLNYHFKIGISVYAGPIFYWHSILPAEDQKLAGYSLIIGLRFQ